jgi:hypothetical protein
LDLNVKFRSEAVEQLLQNVQPGQKEGVNVG